MLGLGSAKQAELESHGVKSLYNPIPRFRSLVPEFTSELVTPQDHCTTRALRRTNRRAGYVRRGAAAPLMSVESESLH